MVVAEISVGADAGVVGSGAAAVVSGEAGFAGAFSTLADAALFPAAELTFVSIAAEVLALAKWTAHNLVLLGRTR